MAISQGTWGTNNWKLPDLGITEKLGLVYNPNRSTGLANTPSNQGYPTQAVSQPSFNQGSIYKSPAPLDPSYQGKVLSINDGFGNKNTGGTGGTGGGNGNGADGDINRVTGQGNDALSLIDQDYNDSISYLQGQEQGLGEQAGLATSTAEGEASKIKSTAEAEGATKTSNYESQLAGAEKSGASAMQQARDLFRQTQQNNIAQLSGAGLSSSSVAEALAERLGVETARRISGVTGSIEEVRQNVAKEITNVKNYVVQRKADADKWLSDQKMKIQYDLNAGLREINNQKNLAASQKAQARYGIMTQVQNNIAQITQQAQQWQQQLDTWAKGQSEKVYTALADIPQILANAQAVTGQEWTPSNLTINPTNFQQAVGPVKLTPKKAGTDNDLEAILARYGVNN